MSRLALSRPFRKERAVFLYPRFGALSAINLADETIRALASGTVWVSDR
jgi:hypothetical protein